MIRKFLTISLLSILFLLPTFSVSFAASNDFSIDNKTEIRYTTGDDFVTVHTEYVRKVLNKSYYYPAQGEKIFHIPDLPDSQDYEITLERQYKKDSLVVKDSYGANVKYSIEDLDSGQGFYVKVPNYKQTTATTPYDIYIEYRTHDLVRKVYDWVVLQAPALPEDIELSQTDTGSGTKTSFSYDLDIITDNKLAPVSKVYPSEYTSKIANGKTIYSFSTKDRIDQAAYLEFGQSQVYKFQLKYKTPKTDQIIPEQYSSMFKALSTNIYELSLPREFSETNQTVKISDIYPTPQKITKDSEGNMIATFEVDANRESEITVEGYIWVSQDTLSETRAIPNPTISDYKDSITDTDYSSKYLSATKYWEVNDQFIKDTANQIADGKQYLMDIIKADYSYVNDKLDYDESKINEGNNRIGAKAALQGGGSVCMEYADSMIALLRAQGIASRAALGYANLDTIQNTPDSNTRHQWVQVWIPEYGWLTIDPTYESKNMKIGQEIDRVLWETFNGDALSNIRIYSADDISDLNGTNYSVKIYAVEPSTAPNQDTLSDYSDIKAVEDSDQPEALDTINTFLKTTTLGKSLIIVTPILFVLVLIVILLSLIGALFRRFKTRKAR